MKIYSIIYVKEIEEDALDIVFDDMEQNGYELVKPIEIDEKTGLINAVFDCWADEETMDARITEMEQQRLWDSS